MSSNMSLVSESDLTSNSKRIRVPFALVPKVEQLIAEYKKKEAEQLDEAKAVIEAARLQAAEEAFKEVVAS